jgi:hypothetical protein
MNQSQPNPASLAAPRAAAGRDEGGLADLLDKPLLRYALALEPSSFDEGWRVATMAAKLKLCACSTPEDAYARIMTGRAIGLPSMASIQGIALIYNEKNDSFTPCMYAKLKVALVLSRRDVIEYMRPDPANNEKTATWRAKRVGEDEQSYTFTIEDAIRADLVDRGDSTDAKKKNNYNRHPRSMLSWRAAGRLCDIVAGDILNGIASREDATEEDERDRGGEPATAPVLPAGRDWAKETAAAKALVLALVRDGDTKGAREVYKRFEADAPQGPLEEIKHAYNEAVATAKGKAPPPATKLEPTKSDSPKPAAPAAQQTLSGAGEYLPPNKRGDSYEGPLEPPR